MTNNKNTQMTVEDKKAVETLNLHIKFRQNINRIKNQLGF